MKSLITYPIHYVDEGLSLTLPEAINHLGRPLVRKDCIDEGGEFVLGNGVTDQALPSLLMGIDINGWIGGMVRARWRIKTRG